MDGRPALAPGAGAPALAATAGTASPMARYPRGGTFRGARILKPQMVAMMRQNQIGDPPSTFWHRRRLRHVPKWL